jgi:hypothetical protein
VFIKLSGDSAWFGEMSTFAHVIPCERREERTHSGMTFFVALFMLSVSSFYRSPP